MRLIIRADASQSLGTGHVMRSSTIAAEFLKLGHEVWYVGEIDSMALIDERLEELGLRDFTIHPNDFQSISTTIRIGGLEEFLSQIL
jgi:spore coat polysaccharide biosynthesis predicted glycosyltransferase SpsG